MEIYQATMEDLEGVSVLFNHYRQFYEQASDLEGAKTYLTVRLEKKDSVIFVVKEDKYYLGFTQLYPTFSSISMKRAWILNDLYIASEARKRGLGEQLLEKAKKFAIETGAVSLSLSTAPDNQAAQRLYEKNGYQKDTNFYHYELGL
ncbi:N-acetyltransferase [Alkalihalobacillus alcalophilus ATCC 27647 = CGMCC 1.3604]|uniref:Acetyltransferase n=1 Tax=Alkalihalobacillus alcalophilus ATCC 27647 = CGMCC 1.3604 TaxID=1218173 RepID=A0A094XHZ4_ALKAL|nr:GNAT family N-acetyltransferase [Alkalihalobacillus alcalophilus]KGA98400.1 acetyltransferase [Alkalihalobacillus alcalophilus ATCC 27647 = CGMCC 1.3604]MED1563936.1 GNAT family N-acetyltransferase [Alkalihalobacillus alcalophilus]THG91578.1 N-acetyltransferase [Alkalihalobacillus alcalophilus ATCC 27647 = CGMCC 1.3604]